MERIRSLMPPEKVEHLRNRDKNWRDNNHDLNLEIQRRYRKENPDMLRAQAARHEAKARQRLTDRYVRRKLGRRLGIVSSEVPDELVDIQRAVMLLKRMLRGEDCTPVFEEHGL